MSIRHRTWKNKNGSQGQSWVLDYTDNGGERRLKTYKRKVDAQRGWAKIQIELDRNTHVPARRSATISEAAAHWYSACEDNGLERTTLDSYKRYQDYIAARLGAVTLTKVTEGMALRFQAQGCHRGVEGSPRQAAGSVTRPGETIVLGIGRDPGRSPGAQSGRAKRRL
jgi:hypothetical protein